MKSKITEFEYWSYKMVYAPFVPYWLWCSLKSGSFSYFCKANPGIKFGGFLDYSKSKIIEQIPDNFKPKTNFIFRKCELNPLPDFPFVVKPDVGQRGLNVEVIKNIEEWENYKPTENLIIQEFVDFEFEFGVFFVRHAGKPKILSITGKEFLTFKSDGIQSISNFVKSNRRSLKRFDYLSQKFKDEWTRVYPKGVEILLEPVGNHNRGTKFFDASHLATKELLNSVETVANSINGFNYGRLDVKAASTKDFKSGKFLVMEVNGVNSEPTHIYDPDFGILRAYLEIKKHLDIQYEISRKQPKTYSSKEFYRAILKRLF